MAIVHMKKLRLMVVRRQKDELLRDLMLLGCVQISEPDALLADTEAAAVLRQESGNVTEVRSELTRLTAALKLLDKYAPVKSKLLSSRPEVTEADFWMTVHTARSSMQLHSSRSWKRPCAATTARRLSSAAISRPCARGRHSICRWIWARP